MLIQGESCRPYPDSIFEFKIRKHGNSILSGLYYTISINAAWKNLLKSVIPKTSSKILNWIGKEQILKLNFKNYSNWIFCLYCIYGLFEWHDLIWLSQSWAIKKRKWVCTCKTLLTASDWTVMSHRLSMFVG